ncbi:MAG: AraC family transcriptional regulator [Phycisphaerales bacterium]
MSTEDIKNIIIAYGGHTLSPDQKQEVDAHTIEEKLGVLYDTNLQTDNLAVIVTGFKRASHDYKFSFDNYPFFRLVYTSKGNATIITKTGKLDIQNGSIYGFAPNEIGQIINQSEKPWDHYYIHFTGKNATKLYNQAAFPSQRVIQTVNPADLELIFENIVREATNQSAYSQIICNSYLNILMHKLATELTSNQQHHCTSQTTYLKCRTYINKNFSKIHTIEQIADDCFVNKVYLCRLFRQYTNISPMQFVIKLKMNKAALLLMQTSYSIKQIAYELNFESQYYFSRTFKKYYGISPKTYREKN